MDTIIYLCRSAKEHLGETERPYEIKIFPIQDYRTIQAKLHESLFAPPSVQRAGLPWVRMRARREKRRYEELRAGFRSELASLLDERDDNYCVADKNLEGRNWRELVPLPEFEGYLERRWVERLLPYAAYPRFVVLGTVPYLPELLCKLAPRMKSLLWLLPDHSYAKMLEDFSEDFYQEYGLAIDMRFLGINESYGQLRLGGKNCGGPLNILDFTEDQRIPIFTPEPGSVWLDMASVEEKERRIEARQLGAAYFSLKNEWKQPQKTGKSLYLLDTARKNRYNT